MLEVFFPKNLWAIKCSIVFVCQKALFWQKFEITVSVCCVFGAFLRILVNLEHKSSNIYDSYMSTGGGGPPEESRTAHPLSLKTPKKAPKAPKGPKSSKSTPLNFWARSRMIWFLKFRWLPLLPFYYREISLSFFKPWVFWDDVISLSFASMSLHFLDFWPKEIQKPKKLFVKTFPLGSNNKRTKFQWSEWQSEQAGLVCRMKDSHIS